MNTDTFIINDTTIAFRCCDNPDKNKYRHYKILDKLFALLKTKGFTIKNNEEVCAILRQSHFTGRKNDLQFKAEKYPIGFRITFYQDINCINPNGGYYDNDKLKNMPYLIQKQFQQTANIICEFLQQFAENDTTHVPVSAENQIKYSYMESCHKPQTNMNFSLSELDGQTSDEYNNKDRDRKTLYNGDFKYFRDNDGYLSCGKIYHNINNMWYVITNDTTIRNIPSFKLFDISADEPRRRIKRHNPPKEYTDRKNALKKCSIKELKNELRRRNVSV